MVVLSFFIFLRASKALPKCKGICLLPPGEAALGLPAYSSPGAGTILQHAFTNTCWSLLICTGAYGCPPSLPLPSTLSRLSSAPLPSIRNSFRRPPLPLPPLVPHSAKPGGRPSLWFPKPRLTSTLWNALH